MHGCMDAWMYLCIMCEWMEGCSGLHYLGFFEGSSQCQVPGSEWRQSSRWNWTHGCDRKSPARGETQAAPAAEAGGAGGTCCIPWVRHFVVSRRAFKLMFYFVRAWWWGATPHNQNTHRGEPVTIESGKHSYFESGVVNDPVGLRGVRWCYPRVMFTRSRGPHARDALSPSILFAPATSPALRHNTKQLTGEDETCVCLCVCSEQRHQVLHTALSTVYVLEAAHR